MQGLDKLATFRRAYLAGVEDAPLTVLDVMGRAVVSQPAQAAPTGYSAVVTNDGTVVAWGENKSGQLGDGTTTNVSAPKLIGTGYKVVAAGYYHSVAIKADGTLWAWGSNEAGQIGDGSTMDRSTPVLIGSDCPALRPSDLRAAARALRAG